MEIEEEEEVEVEVPLMTPMSEKPWDFKTALTCQSPIELSPLVGVKSLSEFIAKFLKPVALAEINWSKEFTARIILLALLFIKMVLLSTPSFAL
jgi:hypothetical protein